ncbi:pilus assembly protein [Erwinia sp. OLTSP20]|uniref:pilus assembly protein PilM n=1 Tax=unclassified Erwinia TaxID=2622719 RepID=UPI000C182DC0|nr:MULTISPECIES: pilus assembly protein PilM [unclassified Erwinia]PIJ51200.1 pilus assembly protein [Erwinia sp. OAMSP11]PIJ73952.1 pilus assembly protein [Erwinia sp. OLSSP12]PIJ83960.1 pilus assembly protein [Erwinia sp. OLCASP19]PIJ86490.1 pilus assembly protein [Erwinia sp. OLMTSP26]PIJ87969.1 pilus assembly protein [Erwinia sp. OLMDSP33]
MAFQHWKIGLDIQNGQLCALAVQHHRRKGWLLRHWWCHPLPADTLVQGVIQHSASLITLLSHWRRRLPQKISLRVGLHPQLVLQRQLQLPETKNRLREPERSRYITAAARRLFPMSLEDLIVDYRQQSPSGELCLTAAHRSALEAWNSFFQTAGLTPEVLELTPAALASLAQTMKLPPQASLVHALSDHWLWFSPQLSPPVGWCLRDDVSGLAALLASRLKVNGPVYVSGVLRDRLVPPACQLPSPFSLLNHLQPPLPRHPHCFALAAGLALRPEENQWYG